MTNKLLAGRTARVTGASQGIGAASAVALAEAGAHVILVARRVKALEAVEDQIHAAGGTSTIAPIDLTEHDAISRLAGAIAGRWDSLDILVISAAYLPELTPLSQIDPKQFNTAIMTNIVATQALLAAFDPLLRKAERVSVLTVVGGQGVAGPTGADIIKMLKRKLASEGVLRELKMRRHYMKPSVKRRKKQAEAARRRRKRAKLDAAPPKS